MDIETDSAQISLDVKNKAIIYPDTHGKTEIRLGINRVYIERKDKEWIITTNTNIKVIQYEHKFNDPGWDSTIL